VAVWLRRWRRFWLLSGLWLKQFVEESERLDWPDTGSLEADLDITAVEASIPTVFVNRDEAPL